LVRLRKLVFVHWNHHLIICHGPWWLSIWSIPLTPSTIWTWNH